MIDKSTGTAIREAVQQASDETASRFVDLYKNNVTNAPAQNIIPPNDLDNVTLGDFNKYVRIQNALENQIQRRNQNTPLSFGEKFAQRLDEHISDEFISKMVNGIFNTGQPAAAAPAKKPGIVGDLISILDSGFMANIGAGIGQNITEVSKLLGAERIGRVIDAYTMQRGYPPSGSPPGQAGGNVEQLSQEEQRRRTEATLMSLDSTNPAHVQEFMNVMKIPDYASAQRTILAQQERILQGRGGLSNTHLQDNVVTEEIYPEQNDTKSIVQNKSRRNRPNDINRQLMEQYDGNSNSSPSPVKDNFFNGTGNPFNPNPINPNLGIGTQSPEEIILSLSPDDPVSLHQYMTIKGIAGVDQSIVKKMMIKEQEQLRTGMMDGVQVRMNQSPGVQENLEGSPQSFPSGDSWDLKDMNKPIINVNQDKQDTAAANKPVQKETKSLEEITGINESMDGEVISKGEFYKEIGFDPNKKDKEPVQNVPLTSPANRQTEQTNQARTEHTNNGELDTILNVIQNLDRNTGNVMEMVSQMGQAVNQMEQKIQFLENKVMTLEGKPDEIKDAVYADIPYEESFPPSTQNLQEFMNTMFTKQIKPVSIEVRSTTPKEIDETSEIKDENKNKVKEENKDITPEKDETSDWWSERNKLLDTDANNKPENKENTKSQETEHKKVIVKRNNKEDKQ